VSRMILPAIDKLAEKYEGKVKVGKFHLYIHGRISIQYGVFTLPTFILFHGGLAVDRLMGAIPMDHIEEMLQNNLSASPRLRPPLPRWMRPDGSHRGNATK